MYFFNKKNSIVSKETKFAKGGSTTASTFNHDKELWFGGLAEISEDMKGNETLDKMLAITQKPATKSNLEKFKEVMADCECPKPELKQAILNQINYILDEKYKSEFKNHFGGSPNDSTSSAAKEFFSLFKQAATYGIYEDGGTVHTYSAPEIIKAQPIKIVSDNNEFYAEGGIIGSGKNGYIAFYKNKQVEVKADSSYQAQQTAAAHFKAKKSYDVNVMLAEKDGEQVIHSTSQFADGGDTEKKYKTSYSYEVGDSVRLAGSQLGSELFHDVMKPYTEKELEVIEDEGNDNYWLKVKETGEALPYTVNGLYLAYWGVRNNYIFSASELKEEVQYGNPLTKSQIKQIYDCATLVIAYHSNKNNEEELGTYFTPYPNGYKFYIDAPIEPIYVGTNYSFYREDFNKLQRAVFSTDRHEYEIGTISQLQTIAKALKAGYFIRVLWVANNSSDNIKNANLKKDEVYILVFNDKKERVGKYLLAVSVTKDDTSRIYKFVRDYQIKEKYMKVGYEDGGTIQTYSAPEIIKPQPITIVSDNNEFYAEGGDTAQARHKPWNTYRLQASVKKDGEEIIRTKQISATNEESAALKFESFEKNKMKHTDFKLIEAVLVKEGDDTESMEVPRPVVDMEYASGGGIKKAEQALREAEKTLNSFDMSNDKVDMAKAMEAKKNWEAARDNYKTLSNEGRDDVWNSMIVLLKEHKNQSVRNEAQMLLTQYNTSYGRAIKGELENFLRKHGY